MKRTLFALLMAIVLVFGLAASASAAQPTPVSGNFDVALDISSVTFTPQGANCRLQVEGVVTFTGDLDGTATAQTTALVFAPCDVVADSQPGSIRDVFTSTMQFTGFLDDTSVSAGIHFHGRVEEGGALSAVMNFSGDLRGSVKVQGQAGVGGTYSGKIVLK